MTDVSDYRGIFSLAGRKAIVTGGSRGIGKALAEGLAAHGADVAIVVQNTVERGEAVAAPTIRAPSKAATSTASGQAVNSARYSRS